MATIDENIEAAVTRSIQGVLEPYLRRLQAPARQVYTLGEAATVLHLSTDSVARLVNRGVLARVPHVDGKVLIPIKSVEQLLSGAP